MRQHVYSPHQSGFTSGIVAPSPQFLARNARPARITYDHVKRLMDIAGAFLVLLLLVPLLPLTAFLIRLTSAGPALYRRRVLSCQPLTESEPRGFDALKFRTMVEGAEEILRADPALCEEYVRRYKLARDPRVTRIGRFLRHYHLDEIPQLVNVLRGEMSLVGPRIISPPELALYGQNAARLLSIRPGLTGLWQVSDRRDAPYEERVRLDMTYIENRSVRLDLMILLHTAGYLLTRRG
jgi:lipopolysaccharide/colanic/teichoic acid biosynthesis glycosyltransferase